MTKQEAREMLKDSCERAELLSAVSKDEILVVVIFPETGDSTVVWEPLVERWYASGWQPVAEYENGEKISEYYTYLDQE